MLPRVGNEEMIIREEGQFSDLATSKQKQQKVSKAFVRKVMSQSPDFNICCYLCRNRNMVLKATT